MINSAVCLDNNATTQVGERVFIEMLPFFKQHHGFRARSKLIGIYGDPYARVIKLVRRQKNSLLGFSFWGK